jgi:hypothetical protein
MGGDNLTRADRNNNPGNIKFGAFAKSMGATGADEQGHAIFPDRETGFKAAEALLGTKDYAGKTLREIGQRWAGGDPGWARNVSKATGIPLDAVPTPEQRTQIARGGIPIAEGTGLGGGMGADLFKGERYQLKGEGGREERGRERVTGGGGPLGALKDQGDRPYYYGGAVSLGGQEYHYGTGGAGRGSVPYGTYSVDIGDIGVVGRRIGSVAGLSGPGQSGGSMFDPKLQGMRGGIQIHSSSSNDLDRLYSQGCFAVRRSEWPRFKQALLDEAAKGPLRITINRGGMAEIFHPDGTQLGGAGGVRGGVVGGGGGDAGMPSWKPEAGGTKPDVLRTAAKEDMTSFADRFDAAMSKNGSKGKVDVDVNFKGTWPGVKTNATADGEIFDKLKVDNLKQAPRADASTADPYSWAMSP